MWNVEEANRLYWSGFFGAPLGIEKPKKKFNAPLVLDLLEGAYLLEEGKIEVFDGERKIGLEELLKVGREKVQHFDEKYAVYRDLRKRGFVVLPGIKYGADFIVYERGPGLEHAPFLVRVLKKEGNLTAEDVISFGRLATSVRKKAVFALVNGKIEYVGLEWRP